MLRLYIENLFEERKIGRLLELFIVLIVQA
jgi:hypothetical protein